LEGTTAEVGMQAKLRECGSREIEASRTSSYGSHGDSKRK
jgi:hypothetical protein